jgi:CRISPR-associated protein Cas2
MPEALRWSIDMSINETRAWLIAYDIANPDRLARVHRCLKKRAVPVQYSVFVTRASAREMELIKGAISELIDERVDDVRIYLIPDYVEAIVLGRKPLPEGILLLAEDDGRFASLLTGRSRPASVT